MLFGKVKRTHRFPIAFQAIEIIRNEQDGFLWISLLSSNEEKSIFALRSILYGF